MNFGEKRTETRSNLWVLLILHFFYDFVIIHVVNAWLVGNSAGHVLYCLRVTGHGGSAARMQINEV